MFTAYHRTCCVKFISFIIILIFFILTNFDRIQFQKYNNITKNGITKLFKFSNNLGYHKHFNRTFELQIRADLAKQGPGLGDWGMPVKLKGKGKRLGEAKLKAIAINEELSERLSYDRKLLDARNELCKNIKYNRDILPTASVIIIYYNEPYSVLLRTVHSILRTTDDKILKEIILVDDASTNIELKGKLNYYAETRFPNYVKILTLPKRSGIVSARLAGANFATGDILVFFDAHCECNIEWLEPLVNRIQQSRTSVVVPIIDSINATDFFYGTYGRIIFQIGGFNWDGHFHWIDVPEFERLRIVRECKDNPEICPTNSPTMSGGLFAINREYFWEIGSYDELMEGWGGENLEMSFRIWQCGGRIETIPCSRIGHIFREFMPYKLPGNRDTHGINTVRMVEVWMDEYIELFYMNRPDLQYDNDFGTFFKRFTLRKNLKCNGFEWYLKHIYPQKFIPTQNVQYYGRIKTEHNICLDNLQQNLNAPHFLGVYECYTYIIGTQLFSLTNDGSLRKEDLCATPNMNNVNTNYIKMLPCSNYTNIEQKWQYENHLLIHINSGLCLDSVGLTNNDFISLKPCMSSKLTQQWSFEHFNKYLN